MSSIVINSVTNEVSGFLVNFTATGIFTNVICYLDNVTDGSAQTLEFSVTQNVTSGLFSIPYSFYNVVDNETYGILVKGYRYFENTMYTTPSNVVETVKLADLTTPIILSTTALDNVVRIDLSNNGYQDNCDSLLVDFRNNTHPEEEASLDQLFTLAPGTDHFFINVAHNFDIYEFTCRTLDTADENNLRFSQISNTLAGFSINSSNPATPTSETIASDGTNCQVTTSLSFVNDWESGHDDYSTIRVYVYINDAATTPYATYDLSTATIKANSLSHDIVVNVAAGQQYNLNYTTKNIDNAASNESSKTTLNSYWTAFDPVPDEVTNVQLVNIDEENLQVSWTGLTDATAVAVGFNIQKYIFELLDPDSNVINTQDILQNTPDTNTAYTLVLDNGTHGVTAGVVYTARVKVEFETFHENTGNNSLYYSSVDSTTRMAYKMSDDFIQLENNQISTDGSNIRLELVGSDGSNGIFPVSYNIELMYKDASDNYVNVVDPSNNGGDENLNRFVDATTLHNQSLSLNYTVNMLDHEQLSDTFTTNTVIRYDNFNDDTLGTDYSFKIVTTYKDNDGNILPNKLTTNYNTNSFYIRTYDVAPTYSGVVSINSIGNETANISWTKTTETPAGLTFRRYIVNLFDENNVLQDTSGNENDTDVDNFYILDNETAVLSYLDNGMNYYVKVAVEYIPTNDGITSDVFLLSPFNVSAYLTPFSTNLNNNSDYYASAVTVDSFVNVSTANDFTVSWVVDTVTMINNIDLIGNEFKHYKVELVRADNVANIVGTVNLTNVNVATHVFTNIPYHNSGYKCIVTIAFQPIDDVGNNSTVLADAITSSNLLIPYDTLVNDDSNFAVTSVSIDSFSNVSDKNTLNVSWVVNSTNLTGFLTGVGLDFRHYLIELYDSVSNAVVLTKEETNINVNSYSFLETVFNNNGYKCRVTGYYTPKETTVTSDIIGSPVVNTTTLVPYNTTLSGESVYSVTDVVFTTLDNSTFTVGWTLPVNLSTELDDVGLNFSYYKVELVDAGSVLSTITTNVLEINANSFVFNNLEFNNNGYKCNVTPVFTPKDTVHNELISADVTISVRTAIPFDDFVSDNTNFQVSNVIFPTLNNNSVDVAWTLPTDLTANSVAVGLDFSHFKVDLFDTESIIATKTIDISNNVNAVSHTFTGVNFNNNGYKSNVTICFNPKDADSSTDVICGAVVESTRTIIPYDNLVSDDNTFDVTNILFDSLNDTNLTVSWTAPVDISNNLAAIGLEFKHYKVDISDVNSIIADETTYINSSDVVTHLFTSIPKNNAGYKCNVTCVYKPKDSVDNTISISGSLVTSARTVVPFDNTVTDIDTLKVTSTSISAFSNVDASNSVTVDWGVPSNLSTNLSNIGLQFKHYFIELYDVGSVIATQSFEEVTLATASHLFTNVGYNNAGYKCRVTSFFVPIDTVSNANNVEVLSAVVTDPLVFIPYDKVINDDSNFSVNSVDIPSFDNDNVNTTLHDINVSWDVTYATLNATLSAVGLNFTKYLVELYDSVSNNVVATADKGSAFNTHQFTGVAYSTNNNGYKCRVTGYYTPKDVNVTTDIISNPIISARVLKLFDKVVNDDSNFTMVSPSIDSFTNVASENDVVVSWAKPASMVSNMTSKGLSFKNYTVELVDSNSVIATKTFTQTDFNTLTHTFTEVAFNNYGYLFRVKAVYEPLDAVSITNSVLIDGNNITDARVLKPYDTTIVGESTFKNTSVEFSSFTNESVNSVVVNWVVPGALSTTLSNVGLTFGKYFVELYDAISTTVIDSKNITTFGTHTTTFTGVAYNNNGYRVKVTNYYNPLDAESNATDIISDTVLNARTLIPYDKVVSDDSNFNVTAVNIDSFVNNTNVDNNVTTSWTINTTNLQSKLTQFGLNFKHYLVELINKDNNNVAHTDTLNVITTLTKVFANVVYNNNGYQCRVTGVYSPKDSVSNTANVEVIGAIITSSRTLIPYDKIVNDDNLNYAVQAVSINSFTNVTTKNTVNVSWTLPTDLVADLAAFGLAFRHYYVELVDIDDNSSPHTDTITNLNTLSKAFTLVNFNTDGYTCRVTAVYKPKDVVDTAVNVSSSAITSSRTLIPYDKVIVAQDFVVSYSAVNSQELVVNWNNATDLNSVGLQLKQYVVRVYNSANSVLHELVTNNNTETFNSLSVSNNSHYAEVSAVYQPRDVDSAAVEVTGGYHSEISNTIDIYHVTSSITDVSNFTILNQNVTPSASDFLVSWDLPDYAANFLLFSNIVLKLFKNGVEIASETFTDAYSNNTFTNVPFAFGDYFDASIQLTLKSASNVSYVGDLLTSTTNLYPQIIPTVITNFDLGLALVETPADINSSVNMSWNSQAATIANYQFDKYVVVVTNNTDSVVAFNQNITAIGTTTFDATGIVNGKDYTYDVVAHYKSYHDGAEDVMTPATLTYSDNALNNVVTTLNFLNLDISLNTDIISFDIYPNGHNVNKIQFLAIPDDIVNEDNYNDASDNTNFKIVVSEVVNFLPYGSLSHNFTFNTATHGWNANQGIRLAVVNLYHDNTILSSQITIL